MFLLGMVSPQVIRLAVPDVAHAGRVAGRVYAWSTAGAIAGTFAAGYVLLSTLGMYRTILGASLPCSRAASLLRRRRCGSGNAAAVPVQHRPRRGHRRVHPHRPATRTQDVVAGGDELLHDQGAARRPTTSEPARPTTAAEPEPRPPVHSIVDPDDPTFLHYKHEHIQLEFLRRGRGPRTGRPAGAGHRRRRVHVPALRDGGAARDRGWTWSRSTPG